MDIRYGTSPPEKSVLDEIREALYEIKRHQGTNAPICSARVRNPDELKDSLQRSNWAFTPFTPNPSNRFEPRSQGLSEANRDAARQTNYAGQVLGMPIIADEATAPGMLCIFDYAGSLVREIIINQDTYDTWAKEQGYWRKADEEDHPEEDCPEDTVPTVVSDEATELVLESVEAEVDGIPVYGLWSGSGWAQWPSGELITSPYIRVLRATLRGTNLSSRLGNLENAVICEIEEDGSCGRPVASIIRRKSSQAEARNIQMTAPLSDDLGQRFANGR